jgi:DNA-binding transcriptional LysR family regulator
MGEALDDARIAVRCDNPLIQLQAAAQGVGIAELACCLGDECADLARIWPDEPPVLRIAWLVVHQDLRRSARIRVMTSAIVEAFGEYGGILRRGVTRRKSGRN